MLSCSVSKTTVSDTILVIFTEVVQTCINILTSSDKKLGWFNSTYFKYWNKYFIRQLTQLLLFLFKYKTWVKIQSYFTATIFLMAINYAFFFLIYAMYFIHYANTRLISMRLLQHGHNHLKLFVLTSFNLIETFVYSSREILFEFHQFIIDI